MASPAPSASARSAAGRLPLWRRIRRRAYWLLLVGLLGGVGRLPLGVGRGLCAGLAGLALRGRARDRRMAAANLALAFPALEQAERDDLLRSCGLCLGANLFDALAAGRVLERGLVVEAPGNGPWVAEVGRLAAKGRGVLVLTGHCGCWELLGAWSARRLDEVGLGPLGVVTGTLHNGPVDQLVQERRRELGLKVLPRREGARPLLAHLRRGGVAAVLLDQNTGAASLPVPFFGQPAPTPTGLALLALKHGIPVLPMALGRQGRGHQVEWLPALEPEPAAGTVSSDDLREFLTRCNHGLETLIRRNPAEWVWFHDRWGRAAGPDHGRPQN